MRNALINTALFLFVYVPLTAIVGTLGGYFSSESINTGIDYDLFLWFVITIQLLVPTALAFIAALVLVRLWVLVVGRWGARVVLVGAVASLIPLTQAALWGGQTIGIEWLVVAVLPALILGWFTRFVPATDSSLPE